MGITTVEYGRLVNLGNYENERLSATWEVEPGQTPDEAFAGAVAYVELKIAERLGPRRQAERERELQYHLDDIEGRIEQCKERYDRAKAFLERIGLPVPPSWGDVPF